MRKLCSLVSLLILLTCFSIINGQTRPGFGFKAGINYATQYFPDNNGSFKTIGIFGFTAGGYYNYFINPLWGIQVELSGSGKGSHWRENHYARDEMKDILTYIDLPVLVRYQPFKKFNVHFGPQASYLCRAMQYDYGTGIRSVVEDWYKNIDAGLTAGVEANLDNHVNITLRFCQSLISCYREGGYNYNAFNSYAQLTAGYRFEKSSRIEGKAKSFKRHKR